MKLKYIICLLPLAGIISCSTLREEQNVAFRHEADSVLALMNLDEKIGQLVLYTSHWDVTGPIVSNESEKYIKSGLCGNLFNAHKVDFNRKLQEIAVNETRLGIPLLFGYDVIHGHRTTFPISLGEAASWDMALIEKASRVAAIEATACGVNWTFAPMVDISYDPRWGRVSESAGEDTYLSSQIAKARVRGFQGEDLAANNTLLACVKHFAAYGAPQAGRDYHTVDMSERVLRDYYLPPYKAAIDAGAESVMTSFNEYDGIPASGSTFLLKEILREEWGFEGFVVTDYTSIEEMIPHGVVADERDAAKMSMNAGVDMDMESSAYREHLGDLVEKGELEEAQIDDAVRRVLQAKFKLGLFEDPYRYFDEKREAELLATPEHMEAAHEMALHSMVLLKNDQKTLPLKPGTKIAVIGPHATLQRDLLGSWIADGKHEGTRTILEEIREVNGEGNTLYANGCWFDEEDESGFKEAISVAKRSELIVLTMGESWHWSGEAASRTSISLPAPQTALIKELKKLNKPMVLVLLNGRPLALEEEFEICDAMLEAWFPGNMGAPAISDVLFGVFNPSGKLPMTFPRNLGQVPIHYNVKNTGRPYEPDGPEQKYRSRYLDCVNEPLFPFGYGLSYTTFAYSPIKLSGKILEADSSIEVSVDVSNTGDRQGTEVVQLYIRDMIGSVTRPLKELKAFEKISLEAGETRTVSFHIRTENLSFYRADMSYGPEAGDFEVQLGGNSADVQGETFHLEGVFL